MSNLLSRQERWEMWMAATPDVDVTEQAPGDLPRPVQVDTRESLQTEVDRLRGVIRMAVSALSSLGAHSEANRINQALDAR